MSCTRGFKLLLFIAFSFGAKALQHFQHQAKINSDNKDPAPAGKPRHDSDSAAVPQNSAGVQDVGTEHKATPDAKEAIVGDGLKDSATSEVQQQQTSNPTAAFIMDSAGHLDEVEASGAKPDSALKVEGAEDFKEVVIASTGTGVTGSTGSLDTTNQEAATTLSSAAKSDLGVVDAAATSVVTDSEGSFHTTNLGSFNAKPNGAETEHDTSGLATALQGDVLVSSTLPATIVADAALSKQAESSADLSKQAESSTVPDVPTASTKASATPGNAGLPGTDAESHATASSLPKTHDDSAAPFSRDLGEILLVVGFASTLFLCAVLCFYHLYQQSNVSVETRTVQSNRKLHKSAGR